MAITHATDWHAMLTPPVTLLDVAAAPPSRVVYVLNGGGYFEHTRCATCTLLAHAKGRFSKAETMHFWLGAKRKYLCRTCGIVRVDPE